MNIYAINYIKNKTTEEIEIIYFGEDNVYHKPLGDIYNLYDFIINNDFDNDKLTFCNFPNNQLEKVIFHISKYKHIDSILGYNSMIISNKKKIRGLNYAKMDR